MNGWFVGSVYVVFAIIWVLAGIAAFIYSMVCYGKNANVWTSLMGLLLALFLGPFYWIYYWVDKSYCRLPFSSNPNKLM